MLRSKARAAAWFAHRDGTFRPLDRATMSETDYLALQVNIICLLLFVLGTTAIVERPEWFQ
jgi:hypothetical protein